MSHVDTLLAQHAPWANTDLQWALTPLETFLWLDDRPQYPLLFQITLRFAGSIDPDAMRDAWRFAVGRNPLLRATIRANSRGAVWHASPTGWQELTVVGMGQENSRKTSQIDLEKTSGLHGWLCQTSIGWDLNMIFHHACCDGHGARVFLQDLALAYSVFRRSCLHDDPFFTTDITRLLKRGTHPPIEVANDSVWLRTYRSLRFILLYPKPIARELLLKNDPLGNDRSGTVIGFCSHTFSAEQVVRMQESRKRYDATVNDIAVAMLFDIIGDWQRTHGMRSESRLRVTVPIDLRTREDERMSAANRYSYLFLNRSLKECKAWHELLPELKRELGYLRNTQRGVELLGNIGVFASRPRIMRWVLQRQLCFSTAVLTNLSDPTRRLRKRLRVDSEGFMWLDKAQCIDIQLQTPPLRPGTRWAIGILEYAGRMTFSFQYDTTTIAAPTAASVLQDYVQKWHDVIDGR